MQALMVAAGIMLSRVLGIVRESLKARYLGATGSIAADAFTAAFRIPNGLNYLLGEGALSASFIPVYSRLLARGDQREADRVAGAIGALLALVAATLVLLGVLFAPALVTLIANGADAPTRELAIRLARVFFPGAALFVLGAWCLGILNSHRRFFLPYAANALWNAALIAALLLYRGEQPETLAVRLAWASVIGAALVFLVQLPAVLRVAPAIRANLALTEPVRLVLRTFTPAFVSRGVVQISAYVDQFIASYLGSGAMALLFYAQTITTLPASLFGLSVAASELPEMSSAVGGEEETHAHVRTRMESAIRRIAFFVVPSAAAFVVLGDVIVRTLFQSGRFTAQDTMFTWAILAASAVGLLASTAARLCSTAFFALHDTRTPLRFALIRVALASIAGYVVATRVPAAFGVASQWGAAALTLTSGLAGWVEFTLLRARLQRRIGAVGVPGALLVRLWGAALVAAVLAVGLKVVLPDVHRFVEGALVLGLYGVAYFGMTRAMKIPESEAVFARFRRLAGRGA